MTGIKGKSGRRPRNIEDRKRLSKLYPTAIYALEQCLNSNQVTMDSKLRAAIEVIRQVIGMPRQQQEISAIIGVLGDRLALKQIERANEAQVLLLGSASGGLGGIDALQGQSNEDSATEREEVEAPE